MTDSNREPKPGDGILIILQSGASIVGEFVSDEGDRYLLWNAYIIVGPGLATKVCSIPGINPRLTFYKTNIAAVVCSTETHQIYRELKSGLTIR